MPDFSIVTCISKPEIYQECVLNSAYKVKGDFDIEFIPILNLSNAYSASNALNLGIKLARSNNVILCHQDISFKENWFNLVESFIRKLNKNWAILGCAGISRRFNYKDIGRFGGSLTETAVVGVVYADDKSDPYWVGTRDYEEVHCVDECCFILNKSSGLQFDNVNFNGFHFYGADLSLQARSSGYLVYAANIPIIHYGKYSSSLSDSRYWFYFRRLYDKWHKQFPELIGTHMHWVVKHEPKMGFSSHCPELVSYIPFELESEVGVIQVRAYGINKVVVQ